MTTPPATTTPTVASLISQAEQTVTTVTQILNTPGVQMMSSMIPVPGLVTIEQMLLAAAPLVQKILHFGAAETGKPISQVFADWISAGTPGMPVTPIFSQNPPVGQA